LGGLSGAQLERLVLKDGSVVAHETLLGDLGERIRDVRQGPDGALWLLTDSGKGRVLRVVPAN
jgi:glucose/arabinose dehydrogenase